ncbi:uncharacterized protein LOC125651951 [Ostrea edulis]|uniref:uncharacterized protein LOC125651951 n=1 Tax=Ostrea edulis TaxID=37623 RepID=UPI00209575AB|nr:uncharacterized protein LOC125651951 [Ostrea edulis]XP_048736756.1 uncharacterized protein LOC125651951 [Ostrea edulis]
MAAVGRRTRGAYDVAAPNPHRLRRPNPQSQGSPTPSTSRGNAGPRSHANRAPVPHVPVSAAPFCDDLSPPTPHSIGAVSPHCYINLLMNHEDPRNMYTCKKHKGEPLEHYCESCHVVVCNSCMTSEEHRRHLCTILSDVFEEKKGYLMTFLKTLEESTMKKLETQLQSSVDNVSRYEEKVECIESTIKSEKDMLKSEIDRVFCVVENELSVMKQLDMGKLESEQGKVKSQMKTVQSFIAEAKRHIKGHDKFRLLQFMNELPSPEDMTRNCLCMKVEPPTYESAEKDFNLLNTFCGSVSASKQLPDHHSPLVSPRFFRRLQRQMSRTLMHLPFVIKSFEIGLQWDLNLSPCKSKQDCIWAGYKQCKIVLIDSNGQKMKKIKFGFHVEDFSESKSKDIFVTVFKDKCIKRCTPKGKVRKFLDTADWSPLGICTDRNGDLLVSLTKDGVGKVMRFGTEKNVIQDVIPQRQGVPLLSKPHRLTENADHAICILNVTERNIVILHGNMSYKAIYDGSGDRRKQAQFYPTALCTDKRCHILVTDHNNHCIDLLDRNGKFMMYLVREDKINNPRSLCVDGDGMAWVEYLNGRGGFKILMYLS